MTDGKKRIRDLTVTGLIAAVLCVLSPIAVPVGDVPVSLATLVICVAAGTAGSARSTAAVLVYLILGAVGMPVFAGFTAGAGHLLGPTGGFLAGYVPLALICGIGERRRGIVVKVILAVIGMAAMYVCGTVWYCVWSDAPVSAALAVCVVSFIPVDLVKLALYALMSGRIKS